MELWRLRVFGLVIPSLGHQWMNTNAGVILVNQDSAINHFSDLKGKLVASAGNPALGDISSPWYTYSKKD